MDDVARPVSPLCNSNIDRSVEANMASPAHNNWSPLPANMLSLATETLDSIATNLQWSSPELTRFMLVCRRTAGVAERVRYSSLIISGGQGRRILATLLSGTRASDRYCSLVYRLWYRGWADTEMHLNASLLAETLPLLSNLAAIWLDANPIDAVHMMNRMKKTGMVRECIHPAFAMADMRDSEPCSLWTIPKLEYVRLTGDPVLAGLTWHRRLVSLEIAHVLDHDELANFLSGAENTLLGDALETLSLKLSKSISVSIAFPLIGDTFPHLRNFSIEQTCLPIKDILVKLATPVSSFPRLRTLAMNRVYSYEIPRWGSVFPFEGFPLADLERLLSRIADLHRSLYLIGLGAALYELDEHGRFIRKNALYPVAKRWTSILGVNLEIEKFVGLSLVYEPRPIGRDE
ncbi:hypothetical protein DFP72DRAFT_1080970 [Ephemerocybe angulata]|uniref:Uncharacterized protein n=1 Tax=Ephemerocybe angulata TaxID=980116 RepID=A0A8H6LUT2_9AGAR|nr:hypothetical protein DFP72DRAFT_1080970 [Tulosesus angulatus]